MKSTLYPLLAISLFAALPAIQAQEIVASWALAGEPGDQLSTVGTGSTGITATPVSRGAGISPAAVSFTNNSIAANGWDSGGDTRYYTFGFTVQAGVELQLINFVVGSRTDPSGPRDFALRYSVDGFTSNLGTWQETGTFFVNTLLDLSSVPPITGEVEFRIVAISDVAANGGAIDGATLHRLTNYFSGGDTGSFRFTGTVTTDGNDEEPPAIASVSPISGSTDAPTDTGLTITFDEAIAQGSGSISIYDAANDLLPVLGVDVADTNVVISGNSLNIALPSGLEPATSFYVLIDVGAVQDLSGNAFTGLADQSFWTFTTWAADNVANILAWNFDSLTGGAGNFGPSPLAPNFVAANVKPIGLTRGPGLPVDFTGLGSGAGDAWGSNGWDGPVDLAGAIAAGKFLTFVVGPQAGHALSISEIPAYNIRRSGSGPTTGQWQFQVGNGNFENIGSPIIWGGTTSASGNSQPAISLAGIPALQNIPPGTPVTFRVVNWGATSASGTWYFNRVLPLESPDLVVRGSVELSALPGDDVPPGILTLQPATGADNVLDDASLTLTFDEAVYPVTGSVRIFDASTDTEVDAIDITSTQVSMSVDTIVITPGVAFSPGVSYYVLIDAGIVEDFGGNAFAGISDPTTWTFTGSDDFFPPVLVSVNPVNGATGIDSPSQLVATFDEEIGGSFGNVRLFNADGDVEVASFDVSDFAFQVQFDGNQMIIPLTEPLSFGESYYVQIDSGAVIDSSLNEYSGISDSTSWFFTLRDAPELLDTAPYTEDFVGFVSLETIPFGWTFSGSTASLVYNGDWGAGTSGGLRGNASVLGFQATSSADELTKTLSLKNGTSETITDLTIRYTGRTERIEENRIPGYVVTLNGVEIPALAYSTNEGDGVQKATTISGLSIPPGGSIIISWFTDRGLPSDTSRQIGLSDVSVSIGAEAFPPALVGVTVDPVSLTFDSASVASAVTSDNGSPVTERGFVYAETSVNSNPQIGDMDVVQVIDGAAEVGDFSAALSGLTAATSYAVRSYAVNANGTAYSNATQFTTTATPPAFAGEYFESFSTFAGVESLPAGWSAFSTTGSNGYGGVWGTGVGAGFRGVGEVEEIPSGPVLGYQHTSGTGELIVSLTLVNATGSVLDELFVQYLGRVERAGEGRSPAWTVEFNGNIISELGYSTSLGEDGSVDSVLSGLGIPDGAYFTIQWKSDRDLVGSGSSRQIGIADVLVSTTIPGTPSGSFNEFMAGFFPGETDPDIIGLFANPSGDGIPNILKYYYGADPRLPSQGLTQVASDGSSVTFEFNRNKNLGDDIVAEYQWTNNLSDWFASGSNEAGLSVTISEQVIDDTDPDFDVVRITATVTEGSADGLFLRIEVSETAIDLL